MILNVNDRVTVLANDGREMGEAVIVNINDFREPNMKYAVDADFYDEDYLFLGDENLRKIQEDI